MITVENLDKDHGDIKRFITLNIFPLFDQTITIKFEFKEFLGFLSIRIRIRIGIISTKDTSYLL